MSTGHLREEPAGQRSHEHFALGEKDGRRVGSEVLSDVQMGVQGVGEQRCGLIGLFEHSIGHLFLIEGIATFDNRRPREVITIGEQIYNGINATVLCATYGNEYYLGSTKQILHRCHSRREMCSRGRNPNPKWWCAVARVHSPPTRLAQ